MSTTAVAFSIGGIALIVQLFLWVVLLKAGARWAKIEGATTGRAVTATLINVLAQLAISAIYLVLPPMSPAITIVTGLGMMFVGLLLPIGLIALFLRTSMRKALLAWLPTLLVPVMGVLSVFFIVQPYLFEAFTSPANGMAPTLLGPHFTTVCAVCGKPAYGSPAPHDNAGFETLAICDEFHVQTVKSASTTSEGDKFLVAKYLRPRRWDAIVFRFPGDPTTKYVKRLVGLPGETVIIKDGAVWIDGKKLIPPPSLQGLNYVTEMPNAPRMPPVPIHAGTPDRPAVLGPDEYFVLGNFSEWSLDSRLWETGAPGHPAYAVPESYIIGVVTHIYWPPSRWRILR